MRVKIPCLFLLSFFALFFFGCKTMSLSTLHTDVTFPYTETDHEWNTKYKGEPFVFLLSDYVVEVQEDFFYNEIIHIVIKVQNEEGKKIGEFPLPYDSSREEIKNVQATISNPDGQKFNYSEIHDLTAQEGYAIYSDNRLKIITFPNVTIGSIIDIQYKTIHKQSKVENGFFDTYHFKQPYPVKYLRCILIAPKDMPLNFKYSNTLIEPQIRQSDSTIQYTWIAKYKEKVETEEYMPFREDITERVCISTISDWNTLSRYGWTLFKKNMTLSADLKDTVQKITSGSHDKKEKIQRILKYIQDNFRYVSMNIDFHNYEPHPVDQIFFNKYGDCKDQTLLAMAMLSEIGVTAYPVLASTMSDLASYGDLLPMMSYFNHVILGIDLEGKMYYTDILLREYRFDETSSALSGKNVLVLRPEDGRFVTLPIADKKVRTKYLRHNIALHSDSSASGAVTITLDRSFTEGLRKMIKGMADVDKERWLSMFATQFAPGGTISKIKILNLDQTYENLELLIEYEQKNWAELTDNMMIFGIGATQRLSAFSAPTRQHPIVFLRNMDSEIENEYIIPKDYEVASIPKNVDVKTDFSYYKRTYEVVNRKISEKISSGLIRSYLPQERYQEIRSFYDDLVALTRNRIIIKKK